MKRLWHGGLLKKNVSFAFLFVVLVMLASCSTLITGERISNDPKISVLVRGMTQDRALQIVTGRFDYFHDYSFNYSFNNNANLTLQESRKLISINEAGIVYVQSNYSQTLGKVLYTTSRHEIREVLGHRSSGKREFKFADVTAMKTYLTWWEPWERQFFGLDLLNKEGKTILSFDVAHLSKENLNDLVAALYFLCPNMQTRASMGNRGVSP